MQPYLWTESKPGEWAATSTVSCWLFVRFTVRPEWWWQYVPPKRQLSALLHDILPHKTELFILTAVRTSDSTVKMLIMQLLRDSARGRQRNKAGLRGNQSAQLGDYPTLWLRISAPNCTQEFSRSTSQQLKARAHRCGGHMPPFRGVTTDCSTLPW